MNADWGAYGSLFYAPTVGFIWLGVTIGVTVRGYYFFKLGVTLGVTFSVLRGYARNRKLCYK